MREILTTLIDDTSRQLPILKSAILAEDSQKCMQVAHYSKGACANVGAQAAATVLKQIEREAAGRKFPECLASLVNLTLQLELLRLEAAGPLQ